MFKRGVAMSENMPVVESAAVAARDFFGALLAAIPNWQSRLRANPDEMSQIEQEVQALMSRGGDMVVCGLLSAALRDPSLQAKQDAFRRSFSYPLDRGGCIPKLRMRKPCKNRRQALLAELASSLQLIGRGVQRQSVRASVRDNALMLDWQSSQRWLIT